MKTKRTRRTWAEIDLDKIAHNARVIRDFTAPGAELMAVVKADAYGHGALQIARTVLQSGFTRIAVSMLDEAAELRNAGIQAPILVLSDNEPDCSAEIIKNNIAQVVFSYEMAERLSEAACAAGGKAKIHIKVDTGMGRIGFTPEEAPEETDRIHKLPGIEIEGIFTHFAVADEYTEEADAYTEKQFQVFQRTCERIEKEKHIHIPLRHAANSAAILRFPHMHLDAVRAGIILYGLFPSEASKKSGASLRPAMTLKSMISHVKTVPADTCISYGCTFRTQRPSVIATVPAGYADGYMRVLGNHAAVYIENTGLRAPIVGRVCMDQFMIDITDAGPLGAVTAGDTVVLFGADCDKMPSTDEIASIAGTINYEMTCAISRRVPRVYLQDGLEVETVNRLV